MKSIPFIFILVNFFFGLKEDSSFLISGVSILTPFSRSSVYAKLLSNPLFYFLSGITLIFILAILLAYIGKRWNTFLYSEVEPTEVTDDNPYDPFLDFTALDDNIIQVSNETKIKFSDIAGNEEAKVELKEVVRFLKDPESYALLGASVPKGVLLAGPPGTGKTLLAKAIAGESRTPFLKVSGSQFVELLVGVGASRVRELFEKARALKPAIVFVDEIDSIARTRAGNSTMGGGNDEREQTLNQILTEMDGFKVDDGIVVIGATNRIDILDPAILRAGRFDRQITIGYPNVRERFAILKVHARGKKFKPGLNLNPIAIRTTGLSGADLSNLLNEAAILATRRQKRFITMSEINASIDRIVIGLEGKQLLRVKARQLTAFHEMGHALFGVIINGSDKIEKLTLLPRGETLGTTWTIPSVTQYNSRQIFLEQVLIALSGRAIEELLNGVSECTVGAVQDFEQMTRTLRIMVLRYAMSRLQELKQEVQLRNLYLIGSDVKIELNNIIDNFTTNFLDATYNEVLRTLKILRPGGERLVDELMIFEELSGKELRTIANEYLSRSMLLQLFAPKIERNTEGLLSPKALKSGKQVESRINRALLNLPGTF